MGTTPRKMTANYFDSPITTLADGADTWAPASPIGSSTARSSALATKLTSVLSASYADSDIRDALGTLDAREVPNSAETRRRLRLDVQRDVIDRDGEIVRDFGQVAEQLRRIGAIIGRLNDTCDGIRKQINLARQESSPVLEEAATLLVQKQEVETKQKLLDAFRKHFLIDDDDIAALVSPAKPVNEQFFQVLDRVKQVHGQCEVLLGGENHRLGTDLMEQSSKNLNAAFKKLYNWVQKEFKALDLEDPHIGGSIRRALRVLSERPSLFQNCLTFFAEAREHTLSDAFHSALTDSTADDTQFGRTKPIEFSTHDPLRYVGDMLAWIHSATVSEHEALEGLFISDGDGIAKGIRDGLAREPWARMENEQGPVFDGHKALNDLVSRDLGGVSRSLKQRVELILHGTEDLVTVYKIMNLLAFYHSTFSGLVGIDSTLATTTEFVSAAAFHHFESLMQDETSQMPASSIPEDLSPPPFLTAALEQLTRLMKAYESSLRAPAADNTTDNAFTPILRATLDPVLNMCSELSAQSRLESTDRIMFQMNYLLLVRSTLKPFQFANPSRVSSIESRLSALTSELIDAQRAFFSRASGLEHLLSALLPYSKNEASTDSVDPNTVSSLPQFHPVRLQETAQQLDDFLPSALMDAKEHLSKLKDASLVQLIIQRAAESFCEDFDFVENKILAADEAVGDSRATESVKREGEDIEQESWTPLRELFPRTKAEIRVLLS